ncbi:phasin family protein [Falsiroseomonas sp. HW251]|uniref:phasin family protein n=1 Tax=Falsiroseomonas sp. HW251 TaxID=3390998 RepID=UPI003D322135
MTEMSQTPFNAEQIKKVMERFQMPGIDVQALVAGQRKNIEAFATANRIAADGAAAVSRHQLELFEAAVERIAAMAQDQKMTAEQQRQMVAKAFELAVDKARELAELSRKASVDVYEVMRTRMLESIEEMRQAAQRKPG